MLGPIWFIESSFRLGGILSEDAGPAHPGDPPVLMAENYVP
jgi:hypothetical protein